MHSSPVTVCDVACAIEAVASDEVRRELAQGRFDVARGAISDTALADLILTVCDSKTVWAVLDDLFPGGWRTAGLPSPPLAPPAPSIDAFRRLSSDFYCPITKALFVDPVVAADGYTYERFAIARLMRGGAWRSPVTGAYVSSTLTIPNRTLHRQMHRAAAALQSRRV